VNEESYKGIGQLLGHYLSLQGNHPQQWDLLGNAKEKAEFDLST
jgi:hypothetical protein